MHKKACCFTGHRPDKLPYQGNESSAAVIRLKTRLEKEIRRQIGVGTRVFITGMAMGVDIWCAEIVAMLKKEFSYEHIELIAAVPYPGQSYKWPKDWKLRYKNALNCADGVKTLCPQYISGCMHKRNRFMVDSSDVCIAVWNGSAGGTAYTVDYAEKQNKELIIIDPYNI